jgi:hypothetical protein
MGDEVRGFPLTFLLLKNKERGGMKRKEKINITVPFPWALATGKKGDK